MFDLIFFFTLEQNAEGFFYFKGSPLRALEITIVLEQIGKTKEIMEAVGEVTGDVTDSLLCRSSVSLFFFFRGSLLGLFSRCRVRAGSLL